jgi:hypothetical protein
MGPVLTSVYISTPTVILTADATGVLTIPGASVPVDLMLPPLGTVQGTVYESNGAQPVAGAGLDLRNLNLDGVFLYRPLAGPDRLLWELSR